MRILFTGVSAHGHLLPMVPLMEAALDLGHAVGLVVSRDLAIGDDLPVGVEILPAGPMPLELAVEAARRTGDDVMQPSVAGIGETFGGVQLDLTLGDALPAARAWAPDLVVAEMYSTVGGYLAAALGIPWHRLVLSVDLPPDWAAAIDGAAALRYDAAGLTPVPPTSVLDLWPAALREPGAPAGLRRGLRTRPHRRPGALPAASGGRRVLVTLGTIFSDPDVLVSVVDEVLAADPDVEVVATTGMLLGAGHTAPPARERVTYVGFVPLDELLDGVRLVVSVGGAGTVLGALARGVPLVVWPQGADQPRIAARVAAAGAGRVVELDGLGAGVHEVLSDPAYATAARTVAAQIAATPDAASVVRDLTGQTTRGA